jgi:3-dehydrotetronate 4-kinase
MEGTVSAASVAQWVAKQAAFPIVYSSADAEHVATAQDRYGRQVVAERIETFFGELAGMLVDTGFRRIAVGGGETSGAVVQSLGLRSLTVGSEIDPGVPALTADRSGAIGLALKSGNFGSPDFFEKALTMVGGP